MTTRKDFLVAGALAAAAVPAAASAAPNGSPALAGFDLKAFTALLAGPQTHKHGFTATEINGGEVFAAIRNTLNAYRDVGVAWSDVSPVTVFYHGYSVMLGFDDTIWDQYVTPYFATLQPGKGGQAQFASVLKAGAKGNPSSADMHALVADASARFFVCNNATHGMASLIGKALGKSPNDVYSDLTQHLAPNALLVPAGVWAIHAIQEQHFTLLQTSLAPNA
jgi:hypothetical protein